MMTMRRHGKHETTDGDTDPTTATDREHVYEDERRADLTDRREEAHERFGGVNTGAAFFGWLVAIGVTVLVASIISAIAAAAGSNANLTQDQAQREAGAIGLAGAIALVVVLVIGYYAGGYVAGRMSRFDGARQGFAVWVFGLVITILAVIIGVLFGAKYNVLDRVNLPRIPIPGDAATWGGVITGIVVLVATALAAVAGGSVGRRYHAKVDRTLLP
jgi:hypothetical protein